MIIKILKKGLVMNSELSFPIETLKLSELLRIRRFGVNQGEV